MADEHVEHPDLDVSELGQSLLDLARDEVEPTRERLQLDLALCPHRRPTVGACGILWEVSPAQFRVGVEEELLLVDPASYGLSHTSTRVLHALGDTSADIKHDLYEAQIEIASPPCETVADAVSALRAHRREVANVGAVLLGAGIHPSAE